MVDGDCTHVFCYWCITEWTRKHAICPLCRRQVRVLKHRFDLSDGMPLTFNSRGEWVCVTAGASITASVIDYSLFERVQFSDDEDQEIRLSTHLEQEYQRRLQKAHIRKIRKEAAQRRRLKVAGQRCVEEPIKQRGLTERDSVVRSVPPRNIAARAFRGLQALGQLHRKKFHAADFLMAINWCSIWQSFVSSIPPTVTSMPLSRGTGVVLMQAPVLTWAALVELLFRQIYRYILPHSAVLVFYTINRAGDATQDQFFRKVYRFVRAIYIVFLTLLAICSHASCLGSVAKAVPVAYFILSTIAQWDAMELAPVPILASAITYFWG